VWTGTARNMLGAFPGRQSQSIFYGELVVLAPRPLHSNSNRPPAGVGADFADEQRALAAKAPVWMVHGAYVSETNVTGARTCVTTFVSRGADGSVTTGVPRATACTTALLQSSCDPCMRRRRGLLLASAMAPRPAPLGCWASMQGRGIGTRRLRMQW
jgi:hypothetical protein